MNLIEILLLVNSLLLFLILIKGQHSARLLQRLVAFKATSQLNPVDYHGLPMDFSTSSKPGGVPVVVVATLSEADRASAQSMNQFRNERPMTPTEKQKNLG